MKDTSVIIPNYNGRKYLDPLFKSLRDQTTDRFEIILVDNGSTDGSREFTAQNYPEVRIIHLQENTGFAGAVNAGIRHSRGKYVILLNNDTETSPGFVEELCSAITRRKRAFSCQAKMISLEDRHVLDDAGDYYCALGWAFARGKGKSAAEFNREERIFSSCAGAAIYRKSLLWELGLFDEEHFAYMEDLDISYRARLCGYENWYAPRAVVYHVGSGTSGSRYNQFKIRYSSRNNIYMIYKNMPSLQILINLPLLAAGFGIKLVFFTLKGYGMEYAAGIKNGFQICRPEKKLAFQLKRLPYYLQIQAELWWNVFRRLSG